MFQEEHGDFTYMERIKVPLIHGSLLLMEGASKADWQVNVINVINRGGTIHVAVDGGSFPGRLAGKCNNCNKQEWDDTCSC